MDAASQTPKHMQKSAAINTKNQLGLMLRCMLSALLVLITLAVYHQVSGFKFIIMDDWSYVAHNPHVKSGLTFNSFLWSLTGRGAGNWHPITWLSLMLDYSLWGLNPQGYHITNLVLHLINIILLVTLLTKITGSYWRSLVVGALFALHPQHVESVAWISERKDVLSMLFFLLTLMAYRQYSRRPSYVRYLPVVLLMVLGLMAKPMLVSLPIVLLIFDFWPLKRLRFLPPSPTFRTCRTEMPPSPSQGEGNLVSEKLPLFALALAGCVITLFAQAESGAVRSAEMLPVGVRLANAVVAYAAYLVKMLWPANLAPYYPHPGSALPVWMVIGSFLMLVGVTILAVKSARRCPYFIAGWLWYLVTMLPVIGIVQVGSQALADRYTYIPMIGMYMAIVWLAADIAKSKRAKAALAAAAVIIIAVISFATSSYLPCWRDDVTFWTRTADISPRYYKAYFNVGYAWGYYPDLQRNYRHLKAHTANQKRQLESGIAEGTLYRFREQILLNPTDPLLHYNAAKALIKFGRPSEAANHLRTVIRLNPEPAIRVKALQLLKKLAN